MGFEFKPPKAEAPEKEQNNSEQYQQDAMVIAQRVSRQWEKLVDKVKLDEHALAGSPQLQEIYEMNRPPQSGIQLWFEYQVKFIEDHAGEESAKSRMMYRLKEDLERIEDRVNEMVGMESEAPQTEAPMKEQNNSEPSPERKRELIDAKNALKEVVENIPHDKLKTMITGLTFDFIEGFDGDVNRYTKEEMEAESGNEPDVAAFHVTEKLIRLKEALSE
jgi:hypothetical protein